MDQIRSPSSRTGTTAPALTAAAVNGVQVGAAMAASRLAIGLSSGVGTRGETA